MVIISIVIKYLLNAMYHSYTGKFINAEVIYGAMIFGGIVGLWIASYNNLHFF